MNLLRQDNHYVPELYLKQWAIGGKVRTYRLLVPHDNYPVWKRYSLKQIAYRRHLYTYMSAQGVTDEFEKLLDREYESPARDALSRATSGGRLSTDDWEKLIKFLAAQDVRTPARLHEYLSRQQNELQSFLEETLANSISKMEAAIQNGEEHLLQSSEPEQSPPIYMPLKITTEKDPDGGGVVRVETAACRRMWIESARFALTNTIKYLLQHRWTIFHAPKGVTWPTTDNPVIKLNFKDSKNYDFGGGWGRTKGNIILPLSPKHLMFTQIGDRPPLRGSALDVSSAMEMRRMIIEHADQYIFSTQEEDIQRLRPRTVCSETFKTYQRSWKDWHDKQSELEKYFS